MKKNYILTALMILALLPATAQTDINFDPASTEGTGWIGYMNVFETPANGGGFVFGSGWGTADLIVVDNMDGTVTLKPNRVNDTDGFWQTGNLTGNKIMDATYYLEDDSLAGTSFTFNAEVISNTLDDSSLDYPITYEAFIKVFAPDYSSFTSYTYDLSEGNFTITLDAAQSAVGDHIQYGFNMTGPNVNIDMSFDAQYDAIGGITVGENTTLSVTTADRNEFSVFPNPTANVWNVNSTQQIKSIEVYDVLGKQVIAMNPNTNEATIDTSNLVSGLYVAKISSDKGSKTMKLIKK
ncbi:T9SS type A sorting domain-containing protein [Psychroserpens algicola]|uniref:T9SS type A sorting domain-containing protein n=1 Tax=Psychroserpens algicola TaxID=1719034 RepID=A0ABT0H657_9FLAO|nr:T9SS type A sorting domain-containing protein [Psychroserpens algicola]MCK8479831.1 T9SS type A sorting domain-containing protein [Psychroserpens algicola]